jgi:hypothetical protein
VSTLLTDLTRAWCSVAHSCTSGTVLERWSAEEPTLGRFASVASIVDAARRRDTSDLDERDELQRVLLRLATEDDDARLAMLHVLAPGLTQIIRGYAPRWGWSETEASVVAAALDRIVTFGDRSVVRPAANIVLGVRHTLFERRLREISGDEILGEQVPLDDEIPLVERQAAGEELLGLVGEGVRSGAITRRGARLIVLHRIHGLSTQEVAEAEGRDAAAVRKYRNRAEAALADVAEAVA